MNNFLALRKVGFSLHIDKKAGTFYIDNIGMKKYVNFMILILGLLSLLIAFYAFFIQSDLSNPRMFRVMTGLGFILLLIGWLNGNDPNFFRLKINQISNTIVCQSNEGIITIPIKDGVFAFDRKSHSVEFTFRQSDETFRLFHIKNSKQIDPEKILNELEEILKFNY